jgi:cytochrome c oxidase subunit 4
MSSARSEPSARALVLNLLALLLLAGLSLVLSRIDLGPFGYPVALGIAVVKAGLVAVFFMEILHERASVRLAIGTGVSLVCLLLALIVADLLTRTIPPLAPPPGNAQRAVG